MRQAPRRQGISPGSRPRSDCLCEIAQGDSQVRFSFENRWTRDFEGLLGDQIIDSLPPPMPIHRDKVHPHIGALSRTACRTSPVIKTPPDAAGAVRVTASEQRQQNFEASAPVGEKIIPSVFAFWSARTGKAPRCPWKVATEDLIASSSKMTFNVSSIAEDVDRSLESK